MKKIILVIVIFIIVIFVVNGSKQEKLFNHSENIEIQNNNESQNIISNAVMEVKKQENTLDGKTIAILGDSLMKGYGNEDRGFADYLSLELPNTIFNDVSKSGSTITDNSGTDNIVMINQAENLKQAGDPKPDIILLDGGANDIMGYALGFLNNDLKKAIGTVDMNYNTVSQDDSVVVDLEEVIMKLKNDFPNAKLCYLQPFLLDDETIDHLTNDETAKQEIRLRRDSFYTEIPKICKKWNIEYLDVSNRFNGTGTTYRQDDWIHIKEEGYQILTVDILEKLKEM